MKKFISAVISVALVATLAVSAFAASGINKAEQQIVDKVQAGANGYVALTQYQATMKNYFNKDGVDVTQAQADEICDYIDEIYELSNDYVPTSKTYDLNELPRDVKQQVLDAGVNACSVVGLTLVWDSATTKVVITDEEGTVIFEALPLIEKLSTSGNNGSQIKRTGASDYTIAFVVAGGVILAIIAGVVFSFKKKA